MDGRDARDAMTAPGSHVTRSGAPPDLALFCRDEFGQLVGMLSLYCGDRDVAEELAQEAILRLCKHWKRVRNMGHRRAWLQRVGINLANSHFRRRSAERRATSR